MGCRDLPAGAPRPATCEELVRGWKVTPEVAIRFLLMRTLFEQQTGHELSIISGYRSPEHQRCLGRQGRPAAPVDVSNHTSCPATALDLRISGLPTQALKAELGRAAIEAGFRWGGGSSVDDTGIPSDWPHVDLGPRQQ